MAQKKPDYKARLEQRYKRLGTRTPQCRSCPESDPFCLELHHIAGRKHHGDLAIECANCHRKLSNQQRDHVGTSANQPTGSLAAIGHYLLGLCDLLALVIKTLREFGAWLISKEQGQPT
jgi:hypothetical protein